MSTVHSKQLKDGAVPAQKRFEILERKATSCTEKGQLHRPPLCQMMTMYKSERLLANFYLFSLTVLSEKNHLSLLPIRRREKLHWNSSTTCSATPFE
jgi:hypothetical protein